MRRKISLSRLVIVNNLSFYCLIRSYFYTNRSEEFVFVSMLSKGTSVPGQEHDSPLPYRAERGDRQETITLISWGRKEG